MKNATATKRAYRGKHPSSIKLVSIASGTARIELNDGTAYRFDVMEAARIFGADRIPAPGDSWAEIRNWPEVARREIAKTAAPVAQPSPKMQHSSTGIVQRAAYTALQRGGSLADHVPAEYAQWKREHSAGRPAYERAEVASQQAAVVANLAALGFRI